MDRVDVAYVYLLDETEEKVLMVKNKAAGGSYLTLPGGAVEKGETLKAAAVREVKEETGLDVSVHGILSIAEKFFEERNHHAVFFTFIGKRIGGNLEVALPEEIEEVVWMDVELANEYAFMAGRQEKLLTVPYILYNET